MKKSKIKNLSIIFGIIAVSSTVISCKKSYSCDCRTTYTDNKNIVRSLTKSEPISARMKYRQAEASCNQTEYQMNAVNANLNTDPFGKYYDITSICAVTW